MADTAPALLIEALEDALASLPELPWSLVENVGSIERDEPTTWSVIAGNPVGGNLLDGFVIYTGTDRTAAERLLAAHDPTTPPVPGSRSDFVAGQEPEAVYERAIFAGLTHDWALAVADLPRTDG